MCVPIMKYTYSHPHCQYARRGGALGETLPCLETSPARLKRQIVNTQNYIIINVSDTGKIKNK